MKIGEINKTYKQFQVSSAQILLANGIRYLKNTGLHSFLDFRIADKRVRVFHVPLTKRTLATKRKGWTASPCSKCKDFSLWKNHISGTSQYSFLFVNKILFSISFLINTLWTLL